ncbi:Uncharacterised protein [Escherichia coli]|uniref:Uncharacterized protein n=1 Tax=Escherichia coli TaxID=562 RepID=A0A377F476_ECOLX|nr:Uncharacterised protein [Escherichia coli]
MNTRLFTFAGGEKRVFGALFGWMPWRSPSPWNPPARRSRWLCFAAAFGTKWLLRGITSNERYVVREEKDRLVAKQPSLGRAEATCAALIPIRKNPSWWGLLKTNAGRFLRSSPVTFTLGSNISLLWPVVSTIVGTWARANPSTS